VYVLIRPVDRKEFEQRTFPHAYDILIYQEAGHIYTKDARGNIICMDSSTSCLQDAVNYITQLGGGIIYIKSGTYNISNTIRIQGKNIKIYGDAVLTAPSNVTVINIDYGENIHIEDIAISGGQHGIVITNSQKILVKGVKVSGSSLYGIYVYDSSLVDLTENYVENTQQCGIAIESYSYDIYGIHVRNNKIISAGVSKQACSSGIHIENNKTISDVDVSGNYVANAGLAGISVMKVQHISICNNVVVDSGTDGIVIVATLYSEIMSNIVVGSGKNNVAGYQNGVRIDDPGVSPPSQYNSVTHNILINNIGHAIVERGSANFNMIINNMTIGNGTPQIIKAGANTVVINTIGHVTKASGQATIPANATSTTVSHGLSCTPAKVLVTPLAQPPGSIWISNISSASFTINISTAPTTDLPVAWYTEC